MNAITKWKNTAMTIKVLTWFAKYLSPRGGSL